MAGPACLAPPLSDELLAEYQTLADSAPAEVGDAMQTLLACAHAWWSAPESTAAPIGEAKSTSGRVAPVVPLTDELKTSLEPHIPWMRDLVAMEPLFEPLTGRIREAAFHLLWHAKELTLDREPTTADKLQ